ncbi:MAG: enoyl-ACP reductase [bacterium]|nr:enoyl-ACP reductase [bacterium]
MSNGLLEGKRGIVLGVANDKSIAWACAKACAAQGASLAFSYQGDALKKRVEPLVAAELPGSPTFHCDVSKDDELAAFFENVRGVWDTIDFVIHSVAFANRQDLKNPFAETSREGFALALNVSAYSLVAVAREAATMMPNGGTIAALTYYGSEKVMPHYNVMGVAKAALEASSRYLANDLGPKGIRVNCISAGPLRTLSAKAIPGMSLMLQATERCAPLRRNVTQDDVAQTMIYLLSDLSTGVTGEVVHVDSGYHTLGVADLTQENPAG